MAMVNDMQSKNDARLTWVDPTVLTLDVADTAAGFEKGADKNAANDCTKS